MEACDLHCMSITKNQIIALQLTGGVTASPLTCSLTVQKTILYFQRPFLTCWCFLKQSKTNKNPTNKTYCYVLLENKYTLTSE